MEINRNAGKRRADCAPPLIASVRRHSMQLTGRLTERDLRSGMWLHLTPPWFMSILGVLVLALAFWVLWMSFFGQNPTSGWGKWGVLVFLLYLLLYFGFYVPFSARRSLNQYKALQREFSLSPSETGLKWTAENGNAIIPWTDFLRWKENDAVFLLYVSDSLYHVIPKRLFEVATDIQTFRVFLNEHVGAK